MRTLVWARLPADGTGADVERVFGDMGIEVSRSRELHTVQPRVPGRPRLFLHQRAEIAPGAVHAPGWLDLDQQ
jgi:hypothetical protein